MISVVVPMYNSATTITNTLNSVLKQTELTELLEIIVVDDHSTDNSVSIVENLINETGNQLIRVLKNPQKGVSAARNYGVSKSKGDWIAFLDSDDQWTPQKLEMEIPYLSEEIGAIGGLDFRTVEHTAKVVIPISVFRLFVRFRPLIQTTIVRKDLFDEIGGFDESMSYSEDLDFMSKVAGVSRILLLNHVDIKTNDGKERFGDSGLSANLELMERGARQALSNAYMRGDIGLLATIFLKFWMNFKYFRRKLIVYRRRLKRG